MNYRFNDKVVIITGASSGIGLALAEALAGEKAKLMLAARDAKKLNTVTDRLSKLTDVRLLPCDVSDETQCRKLIEETIRHYGTIDVLINNAGISMRALFSDVELTVLKRLMDVNFWGTVYCTKYALPYISENKGVIAGISSIAGYKGLPGRSGYSASKFAMQGFLESVRIENLKTGVHVLIACPGFTASNIRNTALDANGQAQGESPLNEQKIMPAGEVAESIIKAIKHRKRTIVLTKQGRLMVLLNKLVPAWVDKKVYDIFASEPGSPLK